MIDAEDECIYDNNYIAKPANQYYAILGHTNILGKEA